MWESCEVQGSLCGFEEPNTVNKQMEKNKDLQNKEFNASKYGKDGRQCISASKVAEFEEDQHEKDHSWTLK